MKIKLICRVRKQQRIEDVKNVSLQNIACAGAQDHAAGSDWCERRATGCVPEVKSCHEPECQDLNPTSTTAGLCDLGKLFVLLLPLL